jgi:UDP-N-acetyl-2-amino-2-deoxyglucuronate dehydrogenase
VLRDDKLTAFEFVVPHAGDAQHLAPATEGAGAGANDPKAIGHAWHRLNLEDAIAAIRSHGRPSVDGTEGRKAVELILALYTSAQSGGVPIDLPLKGDPVLRPLSVKKNV